MTYTHKLTGGKMLMDNKGRIVSRLFILDKDGNKIPDGFTAQGNPAYLRAICSNDNLKI